MLIRNAVKSDADIIAKQNILLAQESEGIILEYDTVFAGVQAMFSDKTKGFYVVAEENNKVIGQMMITYEWSDWRNTTIWWIQSVYVQKQWRKKGVFSKLFRYIQQQALHNQVQILRLYAHEHNTNAQKVYEKVGMKKQPYVFFQINSIF
jgi:GNAT superfamily N-acetyltransferase